MPLSTDLSEKFILPNAPFLNDLQGNILKGHGRDHTMNIFFRFNDGQEDAAKAWLASFTTHFVPSASKQVADTNLFKTEGIPGGLFTNVFLTCLGYTYLGIDDTKIPADKKFREGMVASNADLQAPPSVLVVAPGLELPLNDPPIDDWEDDFKEPVHAMVLIADDSPYLVQAMQRAIQQSLYGIATITKEQAGRGLRNADRNGIEHNGYADGVSQPLFFAQDIQGENANGILHEHWQPEAPLKLALEREKRGEDTNTPESYGSYLVFRKIEQNVKAFKDKEKELAVALFGEGHTDEQGELAGAMVVGRFENGTPLMLDGVSVPVGKDEIPNDYTFVTPNSDADAGTRCPFHAHTRKNNPRTDGFAPPSTTPLDANKVHRIVRRGIPYEDVPRKRLSNGVIDDAEQPTGNVGLLFMCFQSDISEQFEFIQRVWANNKDFEHSGVGIGPIVGASAPGTTADPQKWPLIYDDPRDSPATESFLFSDVTRMLGGGYFFAPSLSFLKELSTDITIAPSLQIFAELNPFPTA